MSKLAVAIDHTPDVQGKALAGIGAIKGEFRCKIVVVLILIAQSKLSIQTLIVGIMLWNTMMRFSF